jgi:nucleotide-binding universal stress UspA family protein
VVDLMARPVLFVVDDDEDTLADWWSRSRPPVGGLRVVGCRFSPKAHQTRDFLVRNCVPFEWVDIEQDEEARRLVGETQDGNSHYLLGDSHSLLLDHAKENNCDLLVMGAYDNRLAESLALGSTTEYLMRNSPVPVLVHH